VEGSQMKYQVHVVSTDPKQTVVLPQIFESFAAAVTSAKPVAKKFQFKAAVRVEPVL
jgi:hypothetical protein